MPQEQAPVSDEVEQTRTDWMSQFVRSVTEAGLSQTVQRARRSACPTVAPTDEPGDAAERRA